MGSQTFFPQRLPRSLLTALLRLQVPIWPWFRAFPVSPFVSRFPLGAPTLGPKTPPESPFLPFSGPNRELVNTIAGLSNPRPDVPKPHYDG